MEKKISTKAMFIKAINDAIAAGKVNLPEGADAWFAKLQEKKVKVKPVFSETGHKIMEFLQKSEVGKEFTSAEIGDSVELSGRSVASGMRKLILEGHVVKTPDSDPITYSITEKGMKADIDETVEAE